MKWPGRIMQLPRSAVLGFAGVALVTAASAMASRTGVIGADSANRLIGLALGAMILVIGNSLPKLRPFPRVQLDARSARVERFSGWILVLGGIAWSALFAFAPLEEAKRISAWIGIVALAVVGVSWTWMARRQSLSDYPPVSGNRVGLKWQWTASLLFAFFYVFVIACLRYLFPGELSPWVWTVLCLPYAALNVSRRRNAR